MDKALAKEVCGQRRFLFSATRHFRGHHNKSGHSETSNKGLVSKMMRL
jgi:hypothetical protein